MTEAKPLMLVDLISQLTELNRAHGNIVVVLEDRWPATDVYHVRYHGEEFVMIGN